MVVQGKHTTLSHNKVVLAKKTYNWRVNNRTHNIRLAKPGRYITVNDNGHKNTVVMTKIIYAKGTQAIKAAKRLRYVINFQHRYFKNWRKRNASYIYRNQNKHKKYKHLTPAQKKRAKRQYKAKILVKTLPKKEVAKRLGSASLPYTIG